MFSLIFCKPFGHFCISVDFATVFVTFSKTLIYCDITKTQVFVVFMKTRFRVVTKCFSVCPKVLSVFVFPIVCCKRVGHFCISIDFTIVLVAFLKP